MWLDDSKTNIINNLSIEKQTKEYLIDQLEDVISKRLIEYFKNNDPDFDPDTEENIKLINETTKIQIIAHVLGLETMDGFEYDPRHSMYNLKYWFKTIHNDRWWDYSYLLDIINHKINDMIIHFKEQCCCTSKVEIISDLEHTVQSIKDIKRVDDEFLLHTDECVDSVDRFCDSFKNIRNWWD